MPPFLSRLLGRKSAGPPGKFGAMSLSDHGLATALALQSSAAGKSVTDAGALQLGTVWACVRLNSEAIASLPLQLFEREPNGGRRPADHPLADVLDSPNADQTGFEFWQGMAAWLSMRGNAYAEVGRLGERVVSLNLLPADRVDVRRNDAGELRYRFVDRGKQVELPSESVLHIRGFGLGGDVGLSPTQYAVQTLGSAIATEEAAAKMFANGLMSSGLLKVAEQLTDEQREQFAKILAAYGGSTRAGKVMLLEAGVEYQQLSLDPESTQMLESRRFSVEEICRWHGVPPIIIGHAAQGQTMWGTGVEAIVLAWLTTGLNPILTRIERRIRKQLIGAGDRRRIYAEFNREALLQADSAGKAAFLSSMVQNGLMSRAEGRAKLNLPSRHGADVLTAQSNLLPLDKLGAGSDGAVKSAFRNWLGLEDSNAQDS
jgi:HK97 family phage portal protein